MLMMEREKLTISAEVIKREVEVIRQRMNDWMNKTNIFRAQFRFLI